jgi:hypothetical protein
MPSARRQFDSCERYRRLCVPDPAALIADYTHSAGCCVARNADAAVRAIAGLEARPGEPVLSAVSPAYEPVAIRIAAQMLDGPRI